jgi:ABC-2 type transport system ATP-binding protein
MLRFDDVGKRFKDTQAVRGVSLAVEPGTVVGMVGHNGAGKSTLMRMAVGLVHPDTGSVTLGGTPLSQFGRLDGLVTASFDAAALPANWTPGAAMSVAAGLSRLPSGRAAKMLEQVGLAKVRNKRIAKFSMGMRQRLAIGLAMLSRPRVLILDEPTIALDPEIIRELHGWITEHAAAGNAVLISSHNLPEVEQIADRIVVMHQGQIVRDSSTLDLLIGNTVRIRVDRPDAFVEALVRAGLAAEPLPDGWLRVIASTTDEVGHLAAAAGMVVRELVREQTRLADVYQLLTTEGATR